MNALADIGNEHQDELFENECRSALSPVDSHMIFFGIRRVAATCSCNDGPAVLVACTQKIRTQRLKQWYTPRLNIGKVQCPRQ